jgi:hypothetical protein
MAQFPFVVGKVDSNDKSVPRTAWDTVQLGQYTLPGISTVEISRARKGIVKSPKDQSYATIKDSGLELAKITITNVIAFKSEMDSLDQILKFFDTQLGVKVTSKTKTGNQTTLQGFAVNHPALQMRGINSVYIEDIIGPTIQRPGFITTTFRCIEVRNVKPASTKKVDPGTSFAEGSTFTPAPAPTPPSKTAAITNPKPIRQ